MGRFFVDSRVSYYARAHGRPSRRLSQREAADLASECAKARGWGVRVDRNRIVALERGTATVPLGEALLEIRAYLAALEVPWIEFLRVAGLAEREVA